MTLAMDAAMGQVEPHNKVNEVLLKSFLLQFNRDGAKIDKVINEFEQSHHSSDFDVEEELKYLKQLNLDWSNSRETLEERKKKQLSLSLLDQPLAYLDGTVCFTHFVYLLKATKGSDSSGTYYPNVINICSQ